MTKKWDGIDRRKSLRAEAEAMVGSFSAGDRATQPTEMLMHELLVHKVELEMQNEELRRAMPPWKRRGIVMWIFMSLPRSAT